jgi:hypothetical protein
MEKFLNFYVKLNQNKPSESATEQLTTKWRKEIEFTLIVKTKDVNTEKKYEKEYCGCYWWDSNGNEGIEWTKNNGKPNFEDPETEEIMESTIKWQVKTEIEKLAKEEEKTDLWMIPSKKDFKIETWINLKTVKTLPEKTKLISVPIRLHWKNQIFNGKYCVEVKEQNIVVDYNFDWETKKQEQILYNLGFFSNIQERIKDFINDLLDVKEIHDLENATQEEN